MGATCKFREKNKYILSLDSHSNFPKQSSNSENKLNLKNNMYGESKKSRNVINFPVDIEVERPNFFIIYPKNKNQLNDLVQLQMKYFKLFGQVCFHIYYSNGYLIYYTKNEEKSKWFYSNLLILNNRRTVRVVQEFIFLCEHYNTTLKPQSKQQLFYRRDSQMTSSSLQQKYESNFTLEGISEGSFNVFRV